MSKATVTKIKLIFTYITSPIDMSQIQPIDAIVVEPISVTITDRIYYTGIGSTEPYLYTEIEFINLMRFVSHHDSDLVLPEYRVSNADRRAWTLCEWLEFSGAELATE